MKRYDALDLLVLILVLIAWLGHETWVGVAATTVLLIGIFVFLVIQLSKPDDTPKS